MGFNKTTHICKCGRDAIAQNEATGEWLCIHCSIKAMIADLERGENVSVSFNHRGIDDVMLVPGDHGEGDLLAPLVDILPVSFCRN